MGRRLLREERLEAWAFIDDGRPVNTAAGGTIHAPPGQSAVFRPSRARPGSERQVEVRSFVRRVYAAPRPNGSTAHWSVVVPA